MIRKRLSEPFDVVYIEDEGLMPPNLDYEQHRKYALTRNIEDIPADVLAKCTVFKCKPLTTDYEYVLSSMAGDASWVIFSKHVISIKGLDVPVDPLEGIKDKYREDIPIDVVGDIAGVIAGKARVDTLPFSPPRTLSADRIRFQSLHVKPAGTESVTD